MPISVTCTGCGKTLTIRDELMGKRIKCPACGTAFSAAEAVAHTKQKQAAGKVGAGIHLSPMVIVFIAALILIPGILLAWKFGPGKVRQQWADLQPHAT